jgi:homocitrate synthase NifV
MIGAVIAAGATVVNIPDTTGYTVPEQYGSLIRSLKDNVPGIDRAVISVHCHDDLGMAVANTLYGVRNGARQVEGTINGLGERAGNAALEEVVMGVRHLHQADCGVDTQALVSISNLVARASGRPIACNKSIVGEAVFTHESGIHIDGLLKNASTYESFDPSELGRTRRTVLGKHSGSQAVRHAYGALGLVWDDEALTGRVLHRIREHAMRVKQEATPDELRNFLRESNSTCLSAPMYGVAPYQA